MYQHYFGFSVPPFENNLDQRFLFFSANHKEVFAALLYFIKLKKSFAMVCGDVGTGKTMLIHSLLNRLPKSVHPILIMNPAVGYLDILRYVASILEIDSKGVPLLTLADRVKEALITASRQGERFVLIIDEAHLLPDASIEQIRLLSNIETQETKLFQILLLGQYELSYKLDRPEMRQIRQRINVNRFLSPMDAEETVNYIDHRLKMAGSGFDACFEANCKDLLFKMTGGVPRSINQLCDNALLTCMAQKRQRVDRMVLKTAGTVLKSDILYTPRKRAAGYAGSSRPVRMLAAVGALSLVLVLIGLAGYRGVLGEKARLLLKRIHPAASLNSHSKTLSAADPAVPSIPDRSPSDTSGASPAPVPSPVRRVPETAAVPSVLKPAMEEILAGKVPPPEDPASRKAGSAPVLRPEEVPARKVALSPLTADEEPGDRKAAPAPLPVVRPWATESSQPPENPAAGMPKSKKIIVKNGDTLMDIASRFYPEDKAGGLQKIMSANPFITDVNWIYKGQELVLPGIGPGREDSTR